MLQSFTCKPFNVNLTIIIFQGVFLVIKLCMNFDIFVKKSKNKNIPSKETKQNKISLAMLTKITHSFYNLKSNFAVFS